MRRTTFLFSALVALILASCSTVSEKTPVSVYVWQRVTEQTDMDTLRQRFHTWKERGIAGVCVETHQIEKIREASALAHAEGLEYHAWIPSMLRQGMPHEWYAVNRFGESADEHPNYVSNYRFLDPANPQVQEYLMNLYTEVGQLPDVDYVRLDFIRYPDVILSSGLMDLYGLGGQKGEYAPADYCYCDYCTETFLRQTGLDIKSVEDPSQVPQWAQFRCDQITFFVDKVSRTIHDLGKKVSVDVFPGPISYAEKMVRQQWDQWMVDMFFPMNYNDFYGEDMEWVEEMVAEEVQAAGKVPVVSGLRICKDWRHKDTLSAPQRFGLVPQEIGPAIRASLKAGAIGVCLFSPQRMSPEHWDALEEALKEI